MKKLLSILICCFVLFGMTGCDLDTEDKGVYSAGDGSTNKEENKKTSFKINETAVFENVRYTVTNVKYSKGSSWDKPAKGKQFVIVTLKIENKSDSKISYNTFDWKMVNSKGQEDTETFTTINSDDGLGSGDLAAGGVKTGTLVFEQDKDETSLKLLYYDNILFDDEATFEVIVK